MNGRNGKNVHLLTAKALKYSTANSRGLFHYKETQQNYLFLGVDKFLGQISSPHRILKCGRDQSPGTYLLEIYWHTLKYKPEKGKRGSINCG